MAVPLRHLFRQGDNIAALARAAVVAARSRGRSGGTVASPGPTLTQKIAPPPPDLVSDYVAHVGGDPGAYAGLVPHHLFPQWAFPLLSQTLKDLPYDLSKVLNAGVTVTMNAPLRADAEWTLTACLANVDEDDKRVLLTQRVTTGPADRPDALVAEVRALIPKKRKGPKGPKKEPTPVPDDATQIGWWDLPADAGRDFAVLTGDFNPIHWIPPAARAAGFKGCILHGFGTLARAIEGVIAAHADGDPAGLASVDVRFARPVVLPSEVGLFTTDEHGLFVGTAPGETAALLGTFVLAQEG